jgi:hypothetical protein
MLQHFELTKETGGQLHLLQQLLVVFFACYVATSYNAQNLMEAEKKLTQVNQLCHRLVSKNASAESQETLNRGIVMQNTMVGCEQWQLLSASLQMPLHALQFSV